MCKMGQSQQCFHTLTEHIYLQLSSVSRPVGDSKLDEPALNQHTG